MSRRCKGFLAGVACLALPTALLAGGLVQDPLQAPSGAQGWWAAERGGETCVSDRAADRVTCWQAGGTLTDLREIAGGWVGAGRLRDGGDELFLVRSEGEGLQGLPLPALLALSEAAAAPRGRPTLVTDDTRLLGLVWLEGLTQAELVVRAAEWLGTGWSEPVTVSPVGPGSQVAPVVTVLADGRWLLVWTAFDGTDDETVWSVFDRGRWSAPTPVHDDNEAPDILPTLVTTRRGAIAAWSWLDGRDYRLRTAFFDGRRWRVDSPSGGRGSLEARFVATSGAYLLSFETVVPEIWAAWEFDDTGHVTGRAEIEQDDGPRPMVDRLGSGVAFLRPEGDVVRETAATWKPES